MKHLNIKQDMGEIKKSFKLLKDRMGDFIKKHLLFKQGIKSFSIVLKWIILLSLIIYSFWYFSYLWKKSEVTKYQKNLILSEQELQKCINTYSMPQYCKINIEESSYPSYNDRFYLPYEDPKMIAKSSDEEFNKYITQTEQCKNRLSKQIATCHEKASILEKEKDSVEKQEVVKNLFSALNSYISLQKNQPKKENDFGRPDNYYDTVLAKEMFSKIPEMKNKCTISELKSKLYYYQERLEILAE